MKSRVLIVEDDDLARDALAAVVHEAGFEVLGFASAEALLEAGVSGRDIVVTDVRMEPVDGLELTRRLRAAHPALDIIAISSFADVPMAVGAMKLGARDFVNKKDGPEAVVVALREAASSPSDQSEASIVAAKLATLTPREMEIFKVVGQGLTSPQISQRLGISRRTVDAHRRTLMVKLDAPRLGHLVRMATVARLV